MLVKPTSWCLEATREAESEKKCRRGCRHTYFTCKYSQIRWFSSVCYLPAKDGVTVNIVQWRGGLCLLCKERSLENRSLTGNPFWLNIQALNFTATLSDWKNTGSRQEALFFFSFHFPRKAEVHPLHAAWIESNCEFETRTKSAFSTFNTKKYICVLERRIEWLNEEKEL